MGTLKLDWDEEEEIVDFDLIAIHTLLPDYRLAYLTNRSLGIHLKKEEDIVLQNKNGTQHRFTKFQFDDKKKDVSYYLLENRDEILIESNDNQLSLFNNHHFQETVKGYLLPELKKPNYFLAISNILEQEMEMNIQHLKKITNLQMVYKIDRSKIKSRNNLILNQ
jgi:hypothetical protein